MGSQVSKAFIDHYTTSIDKIKFDMDVSFYGFVRALRRARIRKGRLRLVKSAKQR